MTDKVYVRNVIECAKKKETVVFVWGAGLLGTGKGYEALKERDIHVDFFCDSDVEKQGKEIIDNIKCVAPENMKKYNNVVCFLLVGHQRAEEIGRIIKELGIENYVTYDDLNLDNDYVRKYFPFMKKPQTVIYTCVVREYDKLIEPQYISDDCDYVYISDKPLGRESVFKWMDIREVLPDGELDYFRQNRYCKINAHKIFPEYKYSIYIDGNVEIINDISLTISKIGRCGMAVASAKTINCTYIEAARCIELNRMNPQKVISQMERYYNEGFPRYFGTFFCKVLTREHNAKKCIHLMEDWWNEVKRDTGRDQLSLPYVLWKNGYIADDLGIIEADGFHGCKYWQFDIQHNVANAKWE